MEIPMPVDNIAPKSQLRKLVLSRDSMTTLTERQAEDAKGGAVAGGRGAKLVSRYTVMCSSTHNCCITLF